MILHSVLLSASSDAAKRRRPLWPFYCFLLFGIVFYAHRALVENTSASRQETSFATIAQCEVRGRGNTNYCHYTFSVGDGQYTGVSEAESDAAFGQIVVVYYDTQDPNTSALRDFSDRSREDKHFVYIFLLVLVATLAFVVWDRSPTKETTE
jgi:hypothetical protein